MDELYIVGQLPRVSTEDRVVSVFAPFDCLIVCSMVSANFLIFPSFILLFLYSTVQKSAVQYSYLFIKQAGADITGQLQVRPMLYTLVCGMWYVVCGMWYVVCGMWYVVRGMYTIGHIPHTTYHIPHTTYHIPHTAYHIPHTKVYSIGRT